LTLSINPRLKYWYSTLLARGKNETKLSLIGFPDSAKTENADKEMKNNVNNKITITGKATKLFFFILISFLSCC
jgi:hypothetical protein